MAGLYLKDNGGGTAGSVGGLKIPPVDHYIAGYQKGVMDANPDAKVANGYSQKFDDPAPCKELALNQIADGAKVVFQVAGGCGLGALDAAKEKGVQGIGVDADQAYLGDQIMTSALKKVDVAVFDAIKAAQDGTFKGGANTIFDVKSGAVGHRQDQRRGRQVRGPGQGGPGRRSPTGEITDIPDAVRSEPTRPRSSSGASPSGSGPWSRTTRWTSSCAVGRSTRCSGRTARASRR